MSHRNPLHPPIPSSAQSGFSSLAPPGPSTKFLTPNRVRVPQKTFAPKSGTQRLSPPIYFDYKGFAQQGVPLKEFASDASRPAITGAGDVVFTKPGVTRITFHILWPGYTHVEWSRSLEINTKTGPMTRTQLGIFVAGNLMRFIEKSQYETINPAERQWKVGSGGIRYENVVLLSLVNTYENSWQAEIAVDF